MNRAGNFAYRIFYVSFLTLIFTTCFCSTLWSEAAAADQIVTSLTLINADTDQPLAGFDPLQDGATLNLATLPTQNLNIRANTDPAVVGSVRFALDQDSNYRTENSAPYALAGDKKGNYTAWRPSLGSHTVTATPYTNRSAGGTAGTPLTITFTVVNESAPQNTAPSVNAGADQAITLPTNSVALSGSASDDGLPNPPGQVSYTWSQVAGPAPVTFGTSDAASTTVSFSSDGTYTLRLQVSDGALSASDEVSITVNPAPPSGPRVASLTLINADTDQPLAGFDPLLDGATVNFATLPTQNLSIRANATDVGSVRFDLDGVVNYQTENRLPYALVGDNSGDYNAWTPSLGSHTVTVVPYPEANLGGTAGTPLTITFTVVNESAPQNTAPSVNAGADQAITLPTNSVALSGSASDDGLPNPPGQVSYTWSQVAGPAPVTFGTSDAASTTVSFSSDGTYTLRLQVSDGALSASDEVSITVNPAPPSGPRVASLTLINADTDQPLAGFDPLLDGATVNFATLPTQNLSIRANATDVGSVRFDLDGVVNYQTENRLPYALVGDNSGDYNAWTPSLGSHTVTVVPYPEANLGGTAGTPLTITFTVVNENSTGGDPTAQLTWTDNSTNEAGFKIERQMEAEGTFVQIATSGANVASYTDSDVIDGTTYCYRVRAFNTAGDSEYSNVACHTVSATTTLTAKSTTAQASSTEQTALSATPVGEAKDIDPLASEHSPTVISGIFRPNTGMWLFDANGNNMWDSCEEDECVGPFMQEPADLPVTGDWDGTGTTQIGVFDPHTGQWKLDLSGNGTWDGCEIDGCVGPFGSSDDLPIVGDWTGTGRAAIGTFQPSTGEWQLDLNGNGVFDGCAVDTCLGPFGLIDDLPIVGDWTGTGRAAIGTFQPSTGEWQLDLNGNGVFDGCAVDTCLGPFGLIDDLPIVGDWTGTGISHIGVFDSSTGQWELDLNANGVFDGCSVDECRGPFGQPGDLPVVGR